jgi:uncharacterized membrane protein YhiD involved in acid resistance
MINTVYLSMGIAAVVLILIIIVAIVVIKQLNNRVKQVHQTLPDLSEIDSLNKVDRSSERVILGDNSSQLNEAMSVSADDEFDRKDYIKENKSTTLEDDFGDALYSPRERIAKEIAKEIAKNTKAVKLPTLADNASDDKNANGILDGKEVATKKSLKLPTIERKSGLSKEAGTTDAKS